MALPRNEKSRATVDESRHEFAGDSPGNIFNLPTELVVYIVSLLMARDKVKLQYVSRRLRNVIETPSLWREFVWPYYHVGDEGRVNNVLKVCGQHVKRLSLHVSAGQLYCPTMMNLMKSGVTLMQSQMAVCGDQNCLRCCANVAVLC